MQRHNNALTSCHDGDAADAIIWRVRCGGWARLLS